MKSEIKKASPLIHIFWERRFLFSFVLVERMESLGTKMLSSQKAVKKIF